MTNNGNLALTPTMGWNSWNAFGKNVTEDIIRKTADCFISLGLKDLGYEYIVIDDHWHGGRDDKGYLFAHPEKFKSGIKALADYVHSKGIKFGIYSCAGTKTCGGEPGSYGYEEKDAEMFAKWEVDFLKYDYCYAPDDYKEAIARYTKMGNCLKATGREILYSICEWGPRAPWLWAREAGGQMWRVSFDVCDIWDIPRNIESPIGILTAIDVMADKEKHAGPGGFNDADMLLAGLKGKGYITGQGCTDVDYQTQMSMWCILASPLFITCDLSNLEENTKRIITNRDLISINQDKSAKQGVRVSRKSGIEIWLKPLSNNKNAVAVLNRNENNHDFDWNYVAENAKLQSVSDIFDVWTKEHFKNNFQTSVEPHGCKVYIVS
jgi:alpha-galactosidase